MLTKNVGHLLNSRDIEKVYSADHTRDRITREKQEEGEMLLSKILVEDVQSMMSE